jgi:hypothetical protein
MVVLLLEQVQLTQREQDVGTALGEQDGAALAHHLDAAHLILVPVQADEDLASLASHRMYLSAGSRSVCGINQADP